MRFVFFNRPKLQSKNLRLFNHKIDPKSKNGLRKLCRILTKTEYVCERNVNVEWRQMLYAVTDTVVRCKRGWTVNLFVFFLSRCILRY